MILTVGLQPPPGLSGVEISPALPEPPALQWSGFLISCEGEFSPVAVLDWTVGIKRTRPAVPIAIVVHESASTDLMNLARQLGADPVVAHPDTQAVTQVIELLSGQAIAGRIVEKWMETYGLSSSFRPHLRILAEVGMVGGRVARVCKRLKCSSAALYRNHADVGLPSPAFLLREARVRGVDLRREAGTDMRIALEMADWREERAFVGVRRRLGGLKRIVPS